MRIMRRAVDAATQTLGWLRRNRRMSVAGRPSPVCINLGCGLAVAPKWINIDGSLNTLVASLPPVFHRLAYRFTGSANYYSEPTYLALLRDHEFLNHDLKYGIPFNDQSVDFVYSSHFVEHLFRKDAVRLMQETFRVLRPGGIVRVVVPDLAYAVSLYGQGRADYMMTQYFFVEEDGAYYSRHKYMYDFQLMSALLRDAGFTDIQLCGFQTGRTPSLDVLDNRPEDSLYVEAVRP